MTGKRIWILAITLTVAVAQTPPPAILINSATGKWMQENGDPPGTESITLREDPTTGALELLARYPAGHVFAPHWHTANERVLLLEGRLSLGKRGEEKFLDPGGYAYLPAREPQYMACVSKTRCAFYVHWDAKLDFHPVSAPAR